MSNLKIDTSKLEIKYLLEIYKESPDYPSHTDYCYVLIRALEDDGLLEQEFTPEQIWPRIKASFGTMFNFRGFLDYVSDPADCPTPILQATRTDQKHWYRLIANPWS
jgi:hypothetical protein